MTRKEEGHALSSLSLNRLVLLTMSTSVLESKVKRELIEDQISNWKALQVF
jgi:uncharacterized phage-associated protein